MQNPLFQCYLSVTDSGAAKARCEFTLLPFSGAGCVGGQKELGLVSRNSAAQLLTNSDGQVSVFLNLIRPSLKWS